MKKLFISLLSCCSLGAIVQAQNIESIRLMTYNLLQYGIGTGQGPGGCSPATVQDKNTYLQLVTGYLKPDILAVNELRWSSNNAYASNIKQNALTYNTAMAVTAASHTQSDPLSNMLFINTNKFGLLRHEAVTGFVRDIDVYRLYHKNSITQGDTTELWVIVGHLKAGTAAADASERGNMANAVMAWLNQHPTIKNYVVMGDMNVYGSNEAAYKNFTKSTDPMRLYDPTGVTTGWSGQTYASLHTQSPRTSATNCGSTGGMDDRFDFILISDAIQNNTDNIGYIANSYKAVGNDGTSYDVALNCTGVVPTSICTALKEMSDHLPVIMDVQMPVTVGIANQLPATIEVNLSPNPITDEILSLSILSRNAPLMSYHIAIMDAMGKEIYHKNLTVNDLATPLQISTHTWAHGVYTLRIADETGRMRLQQVIK